MPRRLVVIAALWCAACSATDSADVTEALDSARSAVHQGEVARALGIVDERLARVTPADNSIASWQLRLLRAELLVMRREVDAAAAIVEPPLPTGAGLDALAGQRAYLRARIQVERGDVDAGMATASDARRLAQGAAETTGDIDLLIGRIHLQRGEFDQAETVLGRLLSSPDDRFRQLQALNNLGNGYLRAGRYDAALTWLERALRLSDFERSQVYATTMANAGICYSRLGLFDRAVEIQRRAIEIQRTQGGPKALVDALGSLGNSHVLKGDPESALPFLEEAYEIGLSAHLDRDAALWAGNLAAAHAALGRWDEAEQYNERSRTLDAGNAVVKASTLVLSAAEVAKGRGDLSRSRELYAQALAMSNGTPAVEWTAQFGLAQVATRAKDPIAASRHFEAALTTVEATRSDLLKADYRLSFLNQLIAFYQAYVDALIDQGKSDRALEIADSSRGRVLAERQRVAAPARAGVAGFQRLAAGTRTTLLSYWLAPTRSFLWVISGSGIRRIDLPPAAEIDAVVREYRAMVDNSLVNPLERRDTPGDRLYEMLIAPAALPRNASVVIVPDGALHGINFETLPVDGPTRHYWIADAQVQVAPSLAMLTTARPRTRDRGDRLLLIGNPTPRPPEFPALSYAPAEMTSIVRHFPRIG